MDEQGWLAKRFEEHRPRLRAVAYRMLGSLAEADDAVQDAWLRLDRDGNSADIHNLGGWLTTVVARVSLNRLRSLARRREDSLERGLPDPVVTREGPPRPEDQLLLADSVGLALLIVLDSLSPDERLAFVLHDVFDVPFDEIAPMVNRSTAAARQLASRARRHVRGASLAMPDTELAPQREIVNAFFSASKAGDFAALLAVLHPDVVLRSDFGTHKVATPPIIRGAEEVAGQALLFAAPSSELIPVLINGCAGVVVSERGRGIAVLAFTVSQSRIVEIDAIIGRDRVARIAADVLSTGR